MLRIYSSAPQAPPTRGRRRVRLGCGSGCGCSARPTLRLGFLGAEADITQQILSQVCPSGVASSPCSLNTYTASYQAFLTQAIQSRFLPPANQSFAGTQPTTPSNCSQYPVSTSSITGLKIGSAAVGIGTGIASSVVSGSTATIGGAAIGTVVPIIGTAIGAILGVITGILGAHSARVQEAAQLLCTVPPQVNAVLQQIDQGLAAGTLTPSDAASAYSQLQSQFSAAMAAGPSYKAGDGMWGYNIAMQAVIAARNYDLQNGYLTGGAPGPWTLPAPAAAAATISAAAQPIEQLLTSTGIPKTTLAWGALAALAFFLLG